MKNTCLSLMLSCLFALGAMGANVTITMNSVSRTMTLTEKSSGKTINIGEPSTNYTYSFAADPGIYVVTGLNTNGTSNGTIEIEINNDREQAFSFTTITAGATNSGWVLGLDYTVHHIASSREGIVRTNTQGTSTTANRVTFLMCIGDSYYVDLIPSSARETEGYLANHLMATVTTGAINATGAIPIGYPYQITVPKDATLFVGRKFAHFVPFTEISPQRTTVEAGKTVHQYYLANGQVYNYRVSQTGKLTQAGYFNMSQKLAPLEITESMLEGNPKRIDHNTKSNKGLNVGDILLNINERGHLKMNVNDKHRMLSMRSWQLTDNSSNNYFIEPDFQYKVINEIGELDHSVITIDEKGVITAIGKGTAIVLVTYDAIALNESYMLGREWGAIWPENTGAFVVTVGSAESGIVPNITINESLNASTKKVAGDAVDAEHDVFYYISNTEGYDYSFTPSGVESVTIAYPTIGEQMATYHGFSSQGVTQNEDGSFKVRLKQGRNIVKMTSASGVSEYQVFTAKPTNFDINNLTNPGETIQPGDEIAITFNGLYHPANKLAGIYNMSAYVQFNGTPNGTSLILSPNQYTFASSASAQTVKLTIPTDWDINTELELKHGVIQVNGYGDPIGNHRTTSPDFGRSPNFTAIAHKTFFGSLPDISIKFHKTITYGATFTGMPEGSALTLYDKNNEVLPPTKENTYSLPLGNYSYVISCPGYKTSRNSLTINPQSPTTQNIIISMEKIGANGWDGFSMSEPNIVSSEESDMVGGAFEDMEGFFKITSGYELAWFANRINNGAITSSAVLINDIDLCDFPWTPIGQSTPYTPFRGTFNGAEKTISGIYINSSKTNQALFGYITAAEISNLNISGSITSTGDYVAGFIGLSTGTSIIQNCHNHASISGKMYVAGIIAYSDAATLTMDNCSNSGSISATGNYCGGVMGMLATGAASFNSTFTNLRNSGTICGTSYTSGILAYAGSAKLIQNCHNTGSVTGSGYVSGISSSSNAKNGAILIKACSNKGNIVSSNDNGYTGGIVGNQNLSLPNQIVVRNCFNTGNIQGAGMLGGISGSMHASAAIENCYNVGVISANAGFAGNIRGVSVGTINNVYSLHSQYSDGATVKSSQEFASGEVAWLLGSDFGQTIGADELPLLDGAAVYKVTFTNNLDTETNTIYTNGQLPLLERNHLTGKWLTSSAGSPVSQVSKDTNLFLQYTDMESPEIPSGLSVTPGGTTITLTWNEPNDNVGVTGYNIYLNNELYDTVETTVHTFTNLKPATVYDLAVEAFDAAGNKSGQATIKATTLITTGCNPNVINTPSVYPNPFDNFIVIETINDGLAYIYNTAGQIVVQSIVYTGTNIIHTVELKKGTYILKFDSTILKIVK